MDNCYPSLEPIVRRIIELYGEDTLAPSVITSWVEDKWYVSIARWRGPRNEMQRQVLFWVTDIKLESAYAEALRRLS